jgi:3-deoxy-manno-octulosonate cytidylyltransferase (CMP-KDO synthetase)
MKVAAVIPVRMGSTRFPGKPLTQIMGRTMVEHVFQRTALCAGLDAGVYVATPDDEIARAVESFGGNVVMTSSAHTRASDRVAEAAEQLDADIVVMIQGDEPLITPQMVELSYQPLLKDDTIFCTNLVRRIDTRDEYEDRNTIKVVMDHEGYALYFSREPIPTIHNNDFSSIKAYKQVCIIPYPKKYLLEFARMEPTELEIVESIDMLRIMESGRRVKMVECTEVTHSVDAPHDVKIVEDLMKNDSVLDRYPQKP